MKKILYFSLALSLFLTACNKDDDDKYYKLPPNTGGTMELQGGEGGVMAKNSVYVDFSTGKQISVERASWNLALHCGTPFGVKLNNTTGSRAIEALAGISTGSILTQQDHDDYLVTLAPAMGGGDFTTADDINSDTDLSGTIIKKDKTYIYCSGEGGKEIYKVKVTEKNSTTYTVAYSLWNSSEVKTLDVVKNGEYNFIGVSFTENKKVDIQPAKDEWDIVWSRNTYISGITGMSAATTTTKAASIPFVMADIVFLNTKAGVKAQEILVAEGGTYNEYTAEKAATAQFSSGIGAIGSSWRNGGGPNAAPSVKTDRFYLIKDVQGNIYKLGFVSMNDGADGGKRGYPEIKYALLIEAK